MNHKRCRPKKARAGCLYCKPHKGNGVGPHRQTPPAALRHLQDEVRDLMR